MKKTCAPLAFLVSLCTLFTLAPAQQTPPRERQTTPPSTQSQQPASPSSPSPSPPSQTSAPAQTTQPTTTPQTQAQTTEPTTAQPPQTRATPPVEVDESEVVRITTNLVQLDVLVTDKHGKQVTDLKPEDFQVLEDGRPQKITNFSYVDTGSPAAQPSPSPTPKPDKNAPPQPPAPPRKLRREDVRRTIALVVDDLSISFSDIYFVRKALHKYIDRYLGEGDLVAIIRTSAGAGAAQQFTNDRRVLSAEIERVRPYLAGNGGMSVFAPVENQNTGMSPNGIPGSDDSNSTGRGSSQSRNGATRGGSSGGANQKDDADSFREEYFTVGTLGALRYVVNGMSALPGRKSIILFSPGFTLSTTNQDDPRFGTDRVLVAARHLVDQANRASVIIYAIDPRGLVYTGLTAADDTAGMSPQQMGDLMTSRSTELFETQGGNQFLADQTGGLAFKNSNDILPAPRILEDLRGYYLMGYRPQGETFNRRFHTITAKLLHHPELTIRARKGFYGVPTDEARATKLTRDQQFITALLSPIAAGDVGLMLTALFTNTERAGSLVSAQLRVDAHDLQFTKQADGKYQAKLDVLGVTFADTGRAVDQRGITQTLDLTEEAYQRAGRAGLLYTINVPVKRPGAYQLRVALRDNATNRIGSASQFIEVPDLKKNRLAISGVVMSGEAQQTTAQAKGAAGGEAAAQATNAREGEVETSDPQSSPAVRHFHARQTVDYACIIFNARTDKTHAQPQLTARAMLYRDGALVFSGKEQPIPTNQPDQRRLIYAGRLMLGANLPPGDYALQVVVTDTLRDDKYRAAAQWIDFEIVQ